MVVDMDNPTRPLIKSILSDVVEPRSVAVQFRYAFVAGEEGVTVLDISNPGVPEFAAHVPLEDAQAVYVARTYAYVAAGHQGLVILDVTRPDQPFVDQKYNAKGRINHAVDVQLGITNVSLFAYVADEEHGLRVIQLTSPSTPGNDGFSPRPRPKLVATYKLPNDGHALAVSRGIDRDRAVDEAGHQIAVFGRVGASPQSGRGNSPVSGSGRSALCYLRRYPRHRPLSRHRSWAAAGIVIRRRLTQDVRDRIIDAVATTLSAGSLV